MTARVLIIEDEMLVAASLEATLEDHGFASVGIAPDVPTALSLASDHLPDLALVDLHLRDGPTGRDLGARLARDYGIKVLFLTANPRLLGEGVPGTLGVLAKPYDEEEVAAAVAYGIGQHNCPTPPAAMQLFAGR